MASGSRRGTFQPGGERGHELLAAERVRHDPLGGHRNLGDPQLAVPDPQQIDQLTQAVRVGEAHHHAGMGLAEGADERGHRVDGERRQGHEVEAPAITLATAATSARAASTARSTSRAAGTNASPAAVSLARRPIRWNSSTPRSRSSALTAYDSDGWATKQAAAAAVKVPCSTTARA